MMLYKAECNRALVTLSLTIAVLVVGTSAAGAVCDTKTRKIQFDHATNTAADPGEVSLVAGEKFQIQIRNTYPDCFEYSYRTIDLPDPPGAAAGSLPPKKDFCFEPMVHDGKPRDYLVFITSNHRKSNCSQAGVTGLVVRGEDNPWVIPVRTHGWTVGFGGGFTFDGLTDPSYALVEAERTVDGETQMGFEVIRQPERDDDYSLGAAAMVHVFHTDQQRWKGWAPLTFGLAVNDGSDVRYFLGTSWRFSDQAFLTAGVAVGGRERLPPGLDLGDNNFTTDANKLNDLDTRTDASWFVGVSYSFLGDKAKAALEKGIPTPTGDSAPSGARSGGTSEPEPKLEADPTSVSLTAASPAEINLTLQRGSQTEVTLELEGANADSFTISPMSKTCQVGSGIPPCAVKVIPKPGLAPGTYETTLVAAPAGGDSIRVTVKLVVSAP